MMDNNTEALYWAGFNTAIIAAAMVIADQTDIADIDDWDLALAVAVGTGAGAELLK